MKIISLFVVVALLSACTQGDSLSNAVGLSSTLAGIDTDQNGIRDDVDDYLEDVPRGYQTAAQGYARGCQSRLTTQFRNSDEFMDHFEENVRPWLQMLNSDEKGYVIFKAIQRKTYNTSERQAKLIHDDSLASGVPITIE